MLALLLFLRLWISFNFLAHMPHFHKLEIWTSPRLRAHPGVGDLTALAFVLVKAAMDNGLAVRLYWIYATGMGLPAVEQVRFARGTARKSQWCSVEHYHLDWASRRSSPRSSKW